MVTAPPFRIRTLHVDDSATPAIHADSLGKDTGSLSLADVKRIETAVEVTTDRH